MALKRLMICSEETALLSTHSRSDSQTLLSHLSRPAVVSADGKEGWIKFGEPGFRAREPLGPDYWLQPEEGALAIFPSSLWHGTESP
jgi:hypothetical protein